MAVKKGYNAEDYKKAIRQAKGNVKAAAEALGVCRTSVYYALDKWKSVQEELDKQRRAGVEVAESELFDAANQGEEWAVRMILRNWKPERYTPKQESEVYGKDGEPIPFQIVDGRSDA